MPIGLVAGHAGAVPRVRATQLYNAIPALERNTWRIFYFDYNSILQEYTTAHFNNPGVNIALETHCLIFCHGRYNGQNGNRSTGISRWDISENEAIFDTGVYTNWLINIGIGIQTIIVAACHAGDIGGGGAGNIPIENLVAVRAGMLADGPNTALNALGGVSVNWNAGGAPAHWTRF